MNAGRGSAIEPPSSPATHPPTARPYAHVRQSVRPGHSLAHVRQSVRPRHSPAHATNPTNTANLAHATNPAHCH